MKFVKSYHKPISICVSIVFTVMLCFWANQAPAAPSAPAPDKDSSATLESSETENTGFIEQEGTEPAIKKGKKFPWLIVALVVVAGGAAAYFLALKKKNYNLTVNVGAGVTGNPAAGTSSNKKGTGIRYSYSLQSGYENLSVTLDGAPVAASGTVTMNADHVLEAKATRTFVLTVNKGAHVTGTPNSGTYTYASGDIAAYSYAPTSGYTNLEVKVDGAAVANAGTITMNADHTLAVTVSKTYTLTVSKGAHVTGTPNSGTYTYANGDIVSYSYAPTSGYTNLEVKVNGAAVPNAGTITMSANRSLTVRVTKAYVLTVSKGAHVTGTPNSGTYTYASGDIVSYSYAPASGYPNLEVKVDGAAVANAGTITMSANHTLAVTASKTYKLTVSKGAHVTGTPNSGTYTYDSGTSVPYSYAPASGYTNLEVKVDGTAVPNAGTITMSANHTLAVTASKTYTLTVSKGAHVTGTPNSGTSTHAAGTSVPYSYAPASGYSNLEVKVDGAAAPNAGTVTMNANHTLTASLKSATIIVNSTPTGARIYMDKVDSGFTTPHTFFYTSNVIMNVRVRAAACGYREYFTTATVNVGQTKTVNANLAPGIGEDFGIPASSCWYPYYPGTWTTFGGQYRFVGSLSGGSPNIYQKSFSGDYTVSAEMNRKQGASYFPNAIFLGSDSSLTNANGYCFIYYTDGDYGIWRFSAKNLITWLGAETQIKSGTSAAIKAGLDQWNVLKIVKVGSNYTFYINNTFIHSFTDLNYNPIYLALDFYCGGMATETRTDLVDLIPGSGSDSIPGHPVNMDAAIEGSSVRSNPMTGEREN